MNVGTRSLLFGVHQFLWHPWTVYRAWLHLYGRPTWRELICIFIHDWGYWGSPNMDGAEGTRHPELGARIAGWLLGPEYHDLVLYHSRHYVRERNLGRAASSEALWLLDKIYEPVITVEPSRLCWADKLSILYDPPVLYITRARLSGEIREYRALAARLRGGDGIPLTASDWTWFYWVRGKLVKLARTMDPASCPYMQGGGIKGER